MSDWGVFLPAFLAALVEWVEAFTIVLAVALGIGWVRAGSAALAALALLSILAALTGGILRLGAGLVWLQGAIGLFLLLFGARWLTKALARQAGLKPLHDEDAEFAEVRASLATAERSAAWSVAFQGVLIEGLEVWLIVVAFAARAAHPAVPAAGALLALVLVGLAGAFVQAPLRRVPENAIKLAVGAMILAGGTFWLHEALAGPDAWPYGDWSLPALFLFYLLGSLGLAWWRRRSAAQRRAA